MRPLQTTSMFLLRACQAQCPIPILPLTSLTRTISWYTLLNQKHLVLPSPDTYILMICKPSLHHMILTLNILLSKCLTPLKALTTYLSSPILCINSPSSHGSCTMAFPLATWILSPWHIPLRTCQVQTYIIASVMSTSQMSWLKDASLVLTLMTNYTWKLVTSTCPHYK